MKFPLHLPIRSATTVVVLGCLVGAAQAQMATALHPNQVQAPFAGQALGVQLAPAGTDAAPVRVRTTGITAGALVPWTTARFGTPGVNQPNYSAAALFAHWAPAMSGGQPSGWDAAAPLHNPTFGDVSTGGDLTPPVDQQGRMIFGGSGLVTWYTLSFTMKEGSVGLEGSALRLNGVGAVGSVFTYVAEGGTRIHPSLVDTVSVDFTAQQLAGSAAPRALRALDWGMGTISVTGNAAPSTVQPHRNRLYFSLDRAWIAAHGHANAAVFYNPDTFQLESANSSTIYGMEWNGTQWTDPVVVMSAADLFGTPQTNAHIDALSVDSGAGLQDIRRVVFSLTKDSTVNNSPVDQILITQPGIPGTSATVIAQPFLVPSGQKVSEKLGLDLTLSGGPGIGPDDVDGLCGRDPNELQHFDPYVGIPVVEAGDLKDPVLPALGITLGRTVQTPVGGNPTDHLFVAAHGIDTQGWDFVFVQLDLETIYGDALTVENTPFVADMVLDPLMVPGNATTLEFEVPFTYKNAASLRGRFRAHGVRLAPFEVVLNIHTSWLSVLGPVN